MANEATTEFLSDDEILGDIKHQEIVTRVEIHRRPRGGVRRYDITADHRSTGADVLNLATAAAGMEPDSTLELGGDRRKRVTHTDVDGKTYVYVEVGGR